MRDASGNISDLVNNTLTDCKASYACKFGLFNSYSVSFTLITPSSDLFMFPKLDSDVAVKIFCRRVGVEVVRSYNYFYMCWMKILTLLIWNTSHIMNIQKNCGIATTYSLRGRVCFLLMSQSIRSQFTHPCEWRKYVYVARSVLLDRNLFYKVENRGYLNEQLTI